MKLTHIAFALSVAFAPLAFAQDNGARSLVERGLAAYVKDGATAAIQAWLKGGALEGNTQSVSQANSLRQVEDFYGKAEAYEILSAHAISPRTTIVVAALYYQKGPLFLRMQVYKLASGESVSTEFKFATDAASLLPTEMVYGQQKP